MIPAFLLVVVSGLAPATPPQVALTGAWSPAERAAVERLLAGVPEAVRRRLPRTVARDARGCDASGWPDDDAELVDARGVHLCAGGADAAAVARRVVTGLLYGFDGDVAWSEAPGWRRLGRWRRSPAAGFALRAENASDAGFAEPRARRSPRWDLATFLAAAWLDPGGPEGIQCRLMSQAAFVRERLGALSGEAAAAPACPAYEGWADLERLAGVEVVLAAPSTAMVGSLFGHVFLRLVYRDEEGETPAHLSRTVAFLADNDVPFQADRGYALKGIAGFYTASLHERPYLDAYREYVVNEGRDLRRWRLNLTGAERAALAARLWTVLRGGRYAYYFFRQNCATLMMELIDEARAPGQEVARAGLLAAPPASTLEAWAAARGADGAPLLQHVPEPIRSFDHEARLRSRHRAALEPRIVAAAPPALAGALVTAFAEARAGGERRAEAYARLATLLADEGAGAPADVREWLSDGAAVESYLSVHANLQAEARADVERRGRARAARDALAARLRGEGAAGHDAPLVAAVALVGDAEPEARMEGYRRLRALVEGRARPAELAARLRLLALLESEVRYDVARLKREPGLRDALLFEDPDRTIGEQPYLRGQADLVTPPVSTAVAPSLRSLQRAREVLFARRALAVAPAAAADDAVAATGAAYDASLSRSGIDQLAVSAAASASAGGLAPALGLGGALYDERLGDHRRFGFDGDTAFVVGRSDVWLGRLPGAGGAAWLGYEARVLGYRSLREPLPEAGRRRGPPGWELFVDVSGSRARALAAEVSAGWGVLAPLVDRGELANHLVAAVDLAYVGFFPTGGAAASGKPQALALPLALEARAALGARPSHRSWLAARLDARPLAVLAGAARRLTFDAGVAAEAHLGWGAAPPDGRHDPALLVRAQARYAAMSFTGASADATALVAVGVELR